MKKMFFLIVMLTHVLFVSSSFAASQNDNLGMCVSECVREFKQSTSGTDISVSSFTKEQCVEGCKQSLTDEPLFTKMDYLQYRTYPNGTQFYQLFIFLRDLAPEDISTVRLFDPNGTFIPSRFGTTPHIPAYKSEAIVAVYDDHTGLFRYEPIVFHGMWMQYNSTLEGQSTSRVLEPGVYSYKIETYDGKLITNDLAFYPGKIVMQGPTVTSSALTQGVDGSLTFEWNNEDFSYDKNQIRINLYDYSGRELLLVNLPPSNSSAQKLTVPAEIVDLALTNKGIETFKWHIQARHQTVDKMNAARANSPMFIFSK